MVSPNPNPNPNLNRVCKICGTLVRRATCESVPVSSSKVVTPDHPRIRLAGVVPLNSAHLDGASQQLTLDCFHSINEAGTTNPTDNWYGAEPVVDSWLGAVAAELRMQRVRQLLPL